jgi:hypothetical protein
MDKLYRLLFVAVVLVGVGCAAKSDVFTLNSTQGDFYRTLTGDTIFRPNADSEIKWGNAKIAFTSDVLIKNGKVISAAGRVLEGNIERAMNTFEVRIQRKLEADKEELGDKNIRRIFLDVNGNTVKMRPNSEFSLLKGNIVIGQNTLISVSGNGPISLCVFEQTKVSSPDLFRKIKIGDLKLYSGKTYIINSKGQADLVSAQ